METNKHNSQVLYDFFGTWDLNECNKQVKKIDRAIALVNKTIKNKEKKPGKCRNIK